MDQTIKPAPVRRSVRVSAPRERAFEVFTAGIGRWWPKSHHIGKADLDTLVIEPRAGGRWYERGVDGTECEVGKVLVWEPPSRLVLAWQLTPDWTFDPDLITEVEVQFIADGANATRVELEHRDLERLGDRADAMRQQIDSDGGWPGLLQLFAQSASQERNAS
jgi:uncharacterized protein YndB with AHSA1/START domain